MTLQSPFDLLILSVRGVHSTADLVGPAVPAFGDQRLTTDHDVLERPHWRKLSVHGFALGEEGQIKTGFHAEEA